MVVDAGGVRQWTGSGALKDAFVQGSLTADKSGSAIDVDHGAASFAARRNTDGRLAHPPLAVIGRKKILNIATMLVGFSNPICTLPDMFEKILLGKC